MRLALHLEKQQSVVFGDHSDIPDILSVEKHSTLTGWFVANLKFPSARSLSYLDFPESFVWDKTKPEWKQRLKGHGTTIGRVYSAHPGEGERFYLRIFLNHVTGCTSFQDIRTLPDGTLCHTFKEAACHRGLLEDDNEYDLCLAMAASWNMPPQLRHLFVTILLYNDPCNPAVLWEKYKYSLSDDFSSNFHENYADHEYVSQKIILCPKNETADLINNHVIHLLPGEGTTLLSADSVEGTASVNFPTEFLNSITPNGMPPHRLFLKKFATVILLRNLDPDEVLCNGTRLIIRAFSNRVIDAEIATGAQTKASVYSPNNLDIF